MMTAVRRRWVRLGRRARFAVWLLGLVVSIAACATGPSAPVTSQPPTAPALSPTQAPTDEPTRTPIAVSTATLEPTPTVAPTAKPTATPVRAPTLRQLTQGRCCTQPFWTADSRQVMFIDKPDASSPTGFYVVDVDAVTPPKLFGEHITFFSSDMQYAISYDAVNSTIERLSDGQKWQIHNGGRSVLLSPNHSRVVWNESGQNGPIETRLTTVMIANLDGSDQHTLLSALRAGVSAWLDDDRLLMTARPNRGSQAVTLSVYSLSEGTGRVLATSEHLRSVLPAPDGTWIAYTIVFDKDPEQNGLWLVRTDGGTARKLDFWGSFQWRDDHRIVYVPLTSDSTNHAFYEYSAQTGVQRRLTGPADPSFKIANGDWVVSPDGSKIVFLESKDLNLWMWSFQD
jgi:Tol biopolymer transport system component